MRMMQPQQSDRTVIKPNADELVTQFLVYQNSKFLQHTEFSQSLVTIGSSPEADLVLNHGAVADFHANIFFKADQIYLKNNKPYNGLRVNGRSVIKTILQLWDVIDIGPYSIVIQQNPATQSKRPDPDPTAKPMVSAATLISGPDRPTDPPIAGPPPRPDSKPTLRSKPRPAFPARYAVILENGYANDIARDRMADQLGTLFHMDPKRIRPLLDRPQHILKKNISLEKAMRLQKILQRAGALYGIKPMEEVHNMQPATVLPETSPPMGSASKPALPETPEPETKATSRESSIVHKGASQTSPEYKLEDKAEDKEPDEEEDRPASFTLKEKLALTNVQPNRRPPNTAVMKPQLEVVRSIGDKVVDVQFISKRGRYQIVYEDTPLRLAGLSAFNKGYVYFPETWQGYLLSSGRQRDLKEFKTDDYLHQKRKRLYRLPLGPKEAVVVSTGPCEYQIRHSYERVSPEVTDPPREKALTWQHWAISVATHLVAVLIACVIFWLHSDGEEKAPLHFVKIDMSQLEPLKKKTPPPSHPKQPPKVKETAKLGMSQKAPKIKKVPRKKPPAKTVKATSKPKRSPKRQGASRHPDAGGGQGKGNVQNRNVKQTGLLSLLGNGTVEAPSETVAAITNLDAVTVPGATDKQFTVGGVKGSLGTGKISVTTAEKAQTKGSQQVLRSAGTSGPGTVAAMEKGQTGSKQVKGMVKAHMTRTVKVEGGMSRAMVKQVIDQHLEEIQFCYESALLDNPSIMGRIVYEWKILMSGRVGEVRIVSSSVNSHQIHDCIKSAIKSWQFPKPVGSEVVVSYPFVFDLVAF